LQAESNYTSLYFKEGSKLISGYSLNGLFDERHFIGIDRVNRKFISEDGFIHLKTTLN